MKIAKNELAYALKKISVANGKNNLVCIEVAGERAAITAFDGDAVQMQQTLKVTADESENGKKYVVPFGKLQDVMSVWKDDDVVITENGGLITLTAAKTKTMVALPFKTEMPELSTDNLNPGTPVKLAQEDFAKGIKELLPLVISDKYPGFLLAPVDSAKTEAETNEEPPFNVEEASKSVPNLTRVWATDGGRCHYFEMAGCFGSEIYLPKVFAKVIAVLKGELTCVSMGDKYLIIKDNENTLALITLLQKKMPYKTLQGILDIAEKDKQAEMEVARADFVDALNLICAVTTDEQKRLSFGFEKGTHLALTLSDTSGKGNTDVAGSITCTADMFAPTYSAEQLLIMAVTAQTDKIRIVLDSNHLFLMNGTKATYIICRFNA